MNIIKELVQGDSASWLDDPFTDLRGRKITNLDYTLNYLIAGPIDTTIDLLASPDGNGWLTTINQETSTSMLAGKYWWHAVIKNDYERFTAGYGSLIVKLNLEVAGPNYDGRTPAEKALADAENALATYRSSKGMVRQYTIGSRSFMFASAAEIMTEINYWRLKVTNEKQAESIANGLGNPRRLSVRFT